MLSSNAKPDLTYAVQSLSNIPVPTGTAKLMVDWKHLTFAMHRPATLSLKVRFARDNGRSGGSNVR